jgi:hypothetical protein
MLPDDADDEGDDAESSADDSSMWMTSVDDGVEEAMMMAWRRSRKKLNIPKWVFA